MARYTGPKNKLGRREGMDLALKTPGTKSHMSLLKRLKIKPGQHGQKMRSKVSDYGRQLREKQKIKRIYGIMERQFKKYYQQATEFKGVTGEQLLQYLERRLDNVVYRLGVAPTRAAAPQMVRHGHLLVDGKRVDIPSYRIRKDQIVSLRMKAMIIPMVKQILSETTRIAPSWIERKGNAGKILSLPKREDITEDINEQLAVEFCSR